MSEPRSLTTLWAFMACYRDSFTFSFFLQSQHLDLQFKNNFTNNKQVIVIIRTLRYYCGRGGNHSCGTYCPTTKCGSFRHGISFSHAYISIQNLVQKCPFIYLLLVAHRILTAFIWLPLCLNRSNITAKESFCQYSISRRMPFNTAESTCRPHR
jgi:hypothetical protein